MNNLSENSSSYQHQADIYQLFSDAEDSMGGVYEYLKNALLNKTVIDIGCGNGKYANLLSPYSQNYIGIDRALPQLQKAQAYNPHLQFIQADAVQLPIAQNSCDIVLATWMLGTIIDYERQLAALQQMKSIIKSGGKIILVENDIDSEFEILRGRATHIDNRTMNYNNWLLKQGFHAVHHINSYFEFENAQTAHEVFYSIWGKRLCRTINNSTIQHKIIIFEMNII